MSSPFAPWANSTLTIELPSEGNTIDPQTGNVMPQTESLIVRALLRPGKLKGDKALQEYAGADRASIFLDGYCVEPMLLPLSVAPYQVVPCEWQGLMGEFVIAPLPRSPWGVDEIAGARIVGMFRYTAPA